MNEFILSTTTNLFYSYNKHLDYANIYRC